MAFHLDISAHKRSTWLTRIALGVLFLGIAVAVNGLLLSVEYRWMKVLHVQSIAGKDFWSRAVLVDTPGRARLILTSDRLLFVEKDTLTCVSERRLLSRRWLRYQLELPGYCRTQSKVPRAIESAQLPPSRAPQAWLHKGNG